MLAHPPTSRLIGTGVNLVTSTPDCQIVFMAYDDKITIYDVRTSNRADYPISNSFRCAAICANGEWLITGSESILKPTGNTSTATLWDLRLFLRQPRGTSAADLVKSISRHELENHKSIATVAISSNGKRVITCSIDGTSLVWDLSNPEKPIPYNLPKHMAFERLQTLNDVEVYPPYKDNNDARLKHPPVLKVTLSQDNTTLLLGYIDGTLKICTITDLDHIRETELVGHPIGQFMELALSTDCHYAFSVVLPLPFCPEIKPHKIIWDLRSLDEIKAYRFSNQHDFNQSPHLISDICNLESVPQLSVFDNICLRSPSRRWAIDHNSLLIDQLNRHTYQLKLDARISRNGDPSGYSCIDGKRAIMAWQGQVFFLDLCPSDSLSFNEVLHLNGQKVVPVSPVRELGTHNETLLLTSLKEEMAAYKKSLRRQT